MTIAHHLLLYTLRPLLIVVAALYAWGGFVMPSCGSRHRKPKRACTTAAGMRLLGLETLAAPAA